MRTWAQELAYAEDQRLHPDPYVQAGGHCQQFVRSTVGVPGYANSALDAALKVPVNRRVSPANAKPGMVGFGAYKDSRGHYRQFGHTWWLVENGYCYSTDLPAHGRIGKVPVSMITSTAGWHMPVLWYTSWTPFGNVGLKPAPATKPVVKVDLSMIQVAAKTDPGAAQGHATYKAGTLIVEQALVAEGLLGATYAKDGSFGTLTRTAYAKLQARLHSSYKDGIPRIADLTYLGKRHGFVVVP
jgi:hypothetical protein